MSVAYLSLYSDDDELQGEAQDVSGVKAMPNRQKDECDHLRQHLVAQDPQPLEDISLKKEKKRERRQKQATSYGLSLFD